MLDAILDGISEGVLATDLNGRVLFANPAARSMLGMSQERIKSVEAVEPLPDPFEDFDLPEAVARCARANECPEAVATRDGAPWRVRLKPLEEFDEHRGGVLVIVHELSKVRHLEARQQRFLSVAAHELKTPITSIIGMAELLQDEEDPALRRRFLDHLDREAHRVHNLSETLLRIARTGHDHRDPTLEAVDLIGAARDAAERAGPLAQAAKLTLRVEGKGGRVLADRGWLDQVLLALLDNAIKYSEAGGAVVLRATGNSLIVEDEGSGISEEDLPHVFEPLYRGGCGAAGAEEGDPEHGSGEIPLGAGLGLPVSRDLVERMGGRISAEQRRGGGTKIIIELPTADGKGPTL